MDLIPGSGRSLGEGYPLQHCCLGNLIDRGAWQPTVRHDLVTKQQPQLLVKLTPGAPNKKDNTKVPDNITLYSQMGKKFRGKERCK